MAILKKMTTERSLYRYLQVIPHRDTRSTVSLVQQLMELLYGFKRPQLEEFSKGAVWFRLLIHRSCEGKLKFYFGFPEDRTTGIYRVLNMLYPGIELVEVSHSELPFTLDDRIKEDKVVGGFMRSLDGDRTGFAFKSYDGTFGFEDVLYSMGDENTSEVWLDILLSPVHQKYIQKDIRDSMKSLEQSTGSSFLASAGLSAGDFAAAFKGQDSRSAKVATQSRKKVDLLPEQKEKLKALSQRFTGREPIFHSSIQILIHGNHPDAQLQTVASTVRNMFQLDNTLHVVKKNNLSKFLFRSIPQPMNKIVMTGPELANIVRLPNGEHRIFSRVPHIERGQRLLKKNELQTGIHIGHVDHPAESKERSVRIPVKEMLKHFVLTGQTGSGKSSMLMEIMDALVQDFIDQPKSGIGFTLFDPAQETAASVLNRLRFYEQQGRPVDWSKVHYFNFSQEKYVLPMNLLHKDPKESIHNLSAEVLELITSAFGPAPQMERITRNSLITLLSDPTVPHSILGTIPLLMNERFRNRIVPRYIADDYMVSQFWSSEFPDLAQNTKSLIGPLLNRLSAIQTSADTRRMFGHHEMKLQIKKWMDEGHIVLFDIKGLSKSALKICGGFVAQQYHKEAQKRVTGSRAHLLIFDEAHETQYPVQATIQAKDRKHGLSLGLCTQFIDQLEKYLVDNITENVGNIFSARQGLNSAKVIAKMTSGSLDTDTLQGLPDNKIAVYTWSNVNGEKKRATTTVRCAPPYVYRPDGSGKWADHENSVEMEQAFKWGLQRGMTLLKRDGILVSEVDDSISTYLKTGYPKSSDPDQNKPTPPPTKQVRNWE
ncbi:DUF87 domain-containing protein [Paenibacillus anaericanus]|uniref:DUF87 domain-containing protein n=1 Tax=Paenibacillus anaericanus TaxID=170367 RepID=A0A3S1DHI7_9BACL|nr:DUF87 domain-containing protein [Paenibacillus anaericanus]RUT39485.1 DUF87 domain-containing protein [Paenibacillus anaericanus]